MKRLVIAAFVWACASTLSAQDRLFALLPGDPFGTPTQDRLIEVDTHPDAFGQIRRVVSLPTRSVEGFRPGGELHSIASGRALVWLSNRGQVVNLFDTQTNQLALFPVLPEGSAIVAADSSRIRVFVDVRNAIVILDGRLGTIRSIPRAPLPHPMTFSVGAHASSVDRLFVSGWPSASNPATVDVVDVATGRLDRTLTLEARAVFGLAVDSDGRRLFAATQEGLQVYDAQSGARLMHLPDFPSFSVNNRNALRIDETNRRLLLTVPGLHLLECGLGSGLAAFDLDTLAPLGIGYGRDPYWNIVTHTVTGPRSPTYLFNPWPEQPAGCGSSRLEALDPISGALRQRVDLLPLWGSVANVPSIYRGRLVLQSPPAAPMIQRQVVTGRRVIIEWAPSYDALHYDVEAGSASGLGDLAISPGHTSPSLTIDGVPSGRYFVRVRAINWVGRSLPSNEVEIVVP